MKFDKEYTNVSQRIEKYTGRVRSRRSLITGRKVLEVEVKLIDKHWQTFVCSTKELKVKYYTLEWFEITEERLTEILSRFVE